MADRSFDAGFLEILVVGILALLVLSPERLPIAVRTVGATIGRIKRGLAEVGRQVESEIGVDDLAVKLQNQSVNEEQAKICRSPDFDTSVHRSQGPVEMAMARCDDLDATTAAGK